MKPITWENIQKFTLKPILKFILKHKKPLAVSTAVIIAIGVTALVFYRRPPVLILTDAPFIELYGKARIRRQRILYSLSMFRRVKPVIVADGASPDILVVAVTTASSRPYCVIFPRYLAPAAESYHQQFPEIPAVVLGGLSQPGDLPHPDGVLCVYRTDQETDLYRAGLLAGLLGLKRNTNEAPKSYFLLHDRYVQGPEREVFSGGVRESAPEAVIRFAGNASEIPGPESISCLVMVRSGAEYIEKNPKIPLILFTWLDLSLIPEAVAAVFDDSAWALAVTAARMAVKSQAEGKIPSKPLVFSGKKTDKKAYRILRRLAKKIP
jgi:hypothetical protein